jgi:L-ascorbate metabolism protein UlaG (beta-lactamase superfamily)
VRRWAKRTLIAAAVLAVAGGAWGSYKFGHPALPAGSQELPAAAPAPGALRAQFFGATTLVFGDGEHAVMVDALLSRPEISEVLFGKIPPDPARIAAALERGKVGKVDLLLISHSHYDHSLDAAEIAKRTGAAVVGSRSTQFVATGGGIPAERTRLVSGGEKLDAGDFHVTVFRSLHSPGDRIPGDIAAPVHPPAKAKDYKTGGTFAYLIEHKGLRILVHASASFEPGMYKGVRADAVFLATGGLGAQPAEFVESYWREVVGTTGAKLAIPIHWDDFLQPLDRPLRPLRRFMDDIPAGMAKLDPLAKRDGVRVRYMPVIAPVDLQAAIKTR